MLLAAILIGFSFSSMVDGASRADADALLLAGRYRDAALAYLSLLRISPDDPDLLDGAGRSMMGLAAPERAIPYFERETVLQPLRWEASQWLSEAYMAAGRFQDAQQLLTRMTTDDPSDGRLWSQLGILFYRTGYYAAAVEALDRALAVDKGLDAPAERNRGEVFRAIALVESGASAEAAKVVPALLARPENGGRLDLLLIDVRLLYETGDYAAAMRQSDRALAAAPQNAAVHFWRALLFQQSGETARAISEAEHARDLDAASPAPRGLLVRLYRRTGREDDAAREAAWLRMHESAGGPGRP